jgi:hypothetical protein
MCSNNKGRVILILHGSFRSQYFVSSCPATLLSIFLTWVVTCENLLIFNTLLVYMASASKMNAFRHLNYLSCKLSSILKCNSISLLRKRKERKVIALWLFLKLMLFCLNLNHQWKLCSWQVRAWNLNPPTSKG